MAGVHLQTEAYHRQPATPSDLDRLEARLVAHLGVRPAARGESPEGFPVTHRFTPGLYVREIFMPAGSIITSKVHLTEHPFTVSQGHCWVFTEGGNWQEIRAPYTGITRPGTRRLLFMVRDTVWSTYHVTDKTDVAEIEEEIILDYQNPLLTEGGEP